MRYREGPKARRASGFRTRAEARDFEDRLRQARRGRGPAPVVESQTLAQLGVEWRRHADLAPSTRAVYRYLWNRHVLPAPLATMPIAAIGPEAVESFAADLESGGVGAGARRKVLAVVATVLQRAVARGRIPVNPARAVARPSARRKRRVIPPTPVQVEALRAVLGPRDAVLVSVLAYAGLRPGEALGLTWADVGERVIVVEASKTSRTRTVRMLAPLASDLAHWRSKGGDGLVFPGRGGDRLDLRNWRRRVFAPAVASSGAGIERPYDLRHAFVSLLIAEGATVLDVARQAGHAPAVALGVYGHVFDEWEGAPRASAEDQIRAARAQYVPTTLGSPRAPSSKNPA